MERDDDRFPKRKNPRLRNFDYSKPGYYFITICAKDKRCIFGGIGSLNWRGELARQKLEEIERHFCNVRVDKYIVMPNHIHAIVVLMEPATALPVVIGQYISTVSKCIHTAEPDLVVWQASYHDHIIRNEDAYRRIWSYIDTNPMRWQDDCFYVE